MENNHVNVLVSGKLGDLIHSLWVCHHLYKTRGVKSNILMTDDIEKFEYGLIPTYNELYYLISIQEYCYQFNLYNQEPIDYDTTKFRSSLLLYNSTWTEIFMKLFFEGETHTSGAWITPHMNYEIRRDITIVSRRYKNEMTPDVIRLYDEITSNADKDVIFLGSLYDYNLFPFKDRVEHVIPNDLNDWFEQLTNCTLFVGNQSAPLAMTSALDLPRIAELLPPQYPDGAHYKNENKYYTNFLQHVI